jgi:hypothetical protein
VSGQHVGFAQVAQGRRVDGLEQRLVVVVVDDVVVVVVVMDEAPRGRRRRRATATTATTAVVVGGRTPPRGDRRGRSLVEDAATTMDGMATMRRKRGRGEEEGATASDGRGGR